MHNKMQGVVLIFCLLALIPLSLLSLAAMERSRLLHKQVASFGLSNQLLYLNEVALSRAVDAVINNHSADWPEVRISLENDNTWNKVTLPADYVGEAEAGFYVQSLGVLGPKRSSPKVITAGLTTKSPVSYGYRITAKAQLNKVYKRIVEMDFITVVYE